MADAIIRAAAAAQPVPEFESTPFTIPPPLANARVAIVTTAALHGAGQPEISSGDQSFRVITAGASLFLGHTSPNFDRSGWLLDPNVVLPIDRLAEMARDRTIGSVAPRHLAFAGNQPDANVTTIRLDSGPAAADLLLKDGVEVVLITGL
jgi:hypothetical protein